MAALREMIAGDRPVAAPVAFNPIMAKLAAEAWFSAAEAEATQKEMFRTFGLDPLIRIEKRTVER